MLPGRIEDDGLVLRRWRESDAEALHAVITESASDLRRWLRWVHELDASVEGCRAFIAESERAWAGGASLLLGIFVGGHLAGGCSLMARRGASGVWEIGYWLAPAYRGHGLATRAARSLTDAALADPRVQAVEIRHDKANLASEAVPRRLGFRFVGEAPNPVPAPADSGADLVWSRVAIPRRLVLRLSLELFASDRGGRRRPILDGYRVSMSFGQRRRDVEPVVHDAIVVLEGSSALAPGHRGLARAWVLMPEELPRTLAIGAVLALLERDRIVGRAEILAMYADPTSHPLDDLHAAKTRRLLDINGAANHASPDEPITGDAA